jgi:hypothetical protein
MKRVAVVLLMCLLVAGTVSAAAINPASVGAAKTIVPVYTQVPVTRIPVSSLPGVLVTRAVGGRGMLEVYSNPSGAGVNLDGANTSGEKTPIKYSLPAGSHSVVIYLDGYQLYAETFTLDAGAIKDINAELKPKSSGSLAPAEALQVSGLRTLDSGSGGQSAPALTGRPVTLRDPDILPGSVTRVTLTSVPVTTTPESKACPQNSNWTCMTRFAAGTLFGDTYAQLGSLPCEVTQVDGQWAYKFCFQDIPSSWSMTPGALASAGIRQGDDVYILNRTWIEHDVAGTSPAALANGAGSANPFQPVFDFFSGIFGGSPPKPELNLQLVELNPCPEPPMGEGPLVGKFR